MKKSERLELIKKIVAENAVETQHDLLKLLEAEGLTLTQATISRDMNEIGIIKVPSVGHTFTVFQKIKLKKLDKYLFQLKALSLLFQKKLKVLQT